MTRNQARETIYAYRWFLPQEIDAAMLSAEHKTGQWIVISEGFEVVIRVDARGEWEVMNDNQ